MLTILEDKEQGIGFQVWPAGKALASLLLDPASSVARLVRNKTILELGAGCGIAGLAAAIAGAKKVFLTDRKETLPHLRNNVKINQFEIPRTSQVCAEELEWGKEIGSEFIHKDSIDVIIASDCMYWASLYDRLVMTLLNLSTPKTLILLVHQTRRKEVERTFYERLARYFVISRVCPLDSPSKLPFLLTKPRLCDGALGDSSAAAHEHEPAAATRSLSPTREFCPDQPREACAQTSQEPILATPCGRVPSHADAAAASPVDATGAVTSGAQEFGGAEGAGRGAERAAEPGEAAGSDPAAGEGAGAEEPAEQGPVYLAYCRLRHSVTPRGAAEALRAYARDQHDGGYALRQLDLLAEDIASIRPA
jgi:predicted nicotinamide N-methyase